MRAWLKPHAKTQGSFLAISRAFQSQGKPSKRRNRELIVDAAKTALEADTSPEIIKSNYLDIVTREEAANFWAIYARKINHWYRASGALCSNTSLGMGAIANCEVYSANLNITDSTIKNGPRGKAREIPLTCTPP